MKQILKNANTEMVKKHLNLGEGEQVSYEEAKAAIMNPDSFAYRIEPNTEVLPNGLHIDKATIELGDGFFTNRYDVNFLEKDGFDTRILTRRKPIYPHRLFVPTNDEKTLPVACINGAFFFLQDEVLESQPEEVMYNLNIRGGEIVGLPSTDRPALITDKEGRIEAVELKAKGLIRINNLEIEWIGGEKIAHGKEALDDQSGAILFNSACCTIQYENPGDKTSLRKLRKDLNLTPKRSGYSDLIIRKNSAGSLVVAKIEAGGGTDFFEGNFILQVEDTVATSINVGDEVKPETLDTVRIDNISSGITTGPFVKHFLEHDDHPINHDPSLGTFPPFDKGARYARSVMYQDRDGRIHMVVFDAVPKSQKMKGVTPKEAALTIPDDAKWAVFLDGGQSSRITYDRGDGTIDAFGNMQYVRLHERHKTGQGAVSEDQFLWSRRGRPLTSMVTVYKQ